jgi:D-tyrosyl-tRNA(Tyr) deacylase
MRAVVQRASQGKVTVKEETVGQIGQGLVVLLGVGEGDNLADAEYLADKVLNLRIFSNEEGKMDLSVQEIAGELLIVPQFTLYGDCSKGRRPDFTEAAPPGEAEELYKEFVNLLEESEIKVETGQFKALMEVELINDGPVTIILES